MVKWYKRFLMRRQADAPVRPVREDSGVQLPNPMVPAAGQVLDADLRRRSVPNIRMSVDRSISSAGPATHAPDASRREEGHLLAPPDLRTRSASADPGLRNESTRRLSRFDFSMMQSVSEANTPQVHRDLFELAVEDNVHQLFLDEWNHCSEHLAEFLPHQLSTAYSLSIKAAKLSTVFLSDILRDSLTETVREVINRGLIPHVPDPEAIYARVKQAEAIDIKYVRQAMWAQSDSSTSWVLPEADNDNEVVQGNWDPDLLSRNYKEIVDSMGNLAGNAAIMPGFRPSRLYDSFLKKVVFSNTVEVPIFWCVSHVWGRNPSDFSPTEVNISGVTWNVKIASLEKLRHMQRIMSVSGVRYWWMDILCIDQDDDTDKVAQVEVMGNVYGNSMGTLVYIDDVNANRLENFLKGSPQFLQAQNFCLQGMVTGNYFPALMQASTLLNRALCVELCGILFSSMWEKRVWTLQEKMLSIQAFTAVKIGNKHLICNMRQILPMLLANLNVFQAAQSFSKALHLPLTSSDETHIRQYKSVCQQWSAWLQRTKSAIPFTVLQTWLSTRSCSIPIDRVYGTMWLTGVRSKVSYGLDENVAVAKYYVELAKLSPELFASVPSDGALFKWIPKPSLEIPAFSGGASAPYNSLEISEETLIMHGAVCTPVIKLSKTFEVCTDEGVFLYPHRNAAGKIYVDLSILPPIRPFNEMPSFKFPKLAEGMQTPQDVMTAQLSACQTFYGLSSDLWPTKMTIFVAEFLNAVWQYSADVNEKKLRTKVVVQVAFMTHCLLNALVLAHSSGLFESVGLGFEFYKTEVQSILIGYLNRIQALGVYREQAGLIQNIVGTMNMERDSPKSYICKMFGDGTAAAYGPLPWMRAKSQVSVFFDKAKFADVESFREFLRKASTCILFVAITPIFAGGWLCQVESGRLDDGSAVVAPVGTITVNGPVRWAPVPRVRVI
ncbi:hypothetical protein HDU83_002806 [Entophlyctis luteolus]|nr:hypothetical protein HDU83_002806 [Entophlyctis luteolus]